MKILIIEDEARIASRIERMVRELLGDRLESLAVYDSLEEGKRYIRENAIDLLLLDLNLNGDDGFGVLQAFSAAAFHTVIISAYQEKAIFAFQYGVLDFVPKPFDRDRLALALARVSGKRPIAQNQLQFLAVRHKGTIRLIDIKDVIYFKGSGIYSEIHLLNGTTALHDKTLEKLAQLLEGSFERIHKSYLVSVAQLDQLMFESRPFLQLKNGEKLPVGRTRYEQLRGKWLL